MDPQYLPPPPAQSASSQATTALVLGIVGSILLCLQIFWIFFAGGMAILSTLAGHH